MSVGFDDLDGFGPDDMLSQMASSPSDNVIAQIASELESAATDLAEVDADLAVGLVECLQECMATMTDCQHCINGILDTDLRNYHDLIYKLSQKVERDVQSQLSEAISAGVDIGIPITDLILVNGTPITTGGVPNNLPDAPPTDVNVVICPEGTTPVTTADNRIVCETQSQPTQNLDLPGKVKGQRFLNEEGKTIEVNLPIQPPVLPVAQPEIGRDFRPVAGFVPIQINQTGPNTQQIFGTVAGQPYVCYHDYQSGFPANTTCFSLEDGFPPTVPPSVPPTPPVGPPSDCPPCVPPSTGGTAITVVEPTPQTTHPFCDPDNLSVPDPNLTFRQPSQATTGRLASTLGADLTTRLTQPTGNDAMDALTNILGTPIVAGGYGIDFVINGINSVIGGVGDAAGKGFATIVSALTSLAGPLLDSGPCQSEAFSSLAVVNFLPSLLSFFGGIIPSQITTPNIYAMNYLCPVLIPSGAEMNALRSKGLITDSQWRIGVKANNLCPEWQEKIVDGIRTIPTPDQLQMAWRRGIIDDEAYDYYMKRNGILRSDDANIWFRLSEFVPGPSDLIRFMVRDAFDDELETNKLADAEFPTKFTERAKQWAQDQGMSDDVFKFFWRSHYVYPSNTQLYQMLHRLRSDQELPGGLGSVKAVDASLIRRVLQINDVSPEFVDRLIALSYSPLTRVDARRAFELGELSEEELKNSYLDLGYSPENAERLLKFSSATSGPIRAKRLGNASTSEVLNWYRDRLIPRDQAEELLRSSGVKQEFVSKYLDTADLRQITTSRKAAISYLRKRYLQGEFDNRQAASALQEANVSPEAIGEIVTQWERQRNAKSKQPTVGMLCDWWTRGYIVMDEFIRRCTNLGYSIVDAQRIVASCQGKEAERREKEAEKLAKEAESRQRRIESDARRNASDIRRQQKEMERVLKELAPCKPPPKPTCEVNGTAE